MASKTITPANTSLPVTVSVAFSVTDNLLTTANLRVKDPSSTVIAGATACTVLVRHGGLVSDTSKPIAIVQVAFKPTTAGVYIVDDSGAAYTAAPIGVTDNGATYTVTGGNAAAILSKTSANLLTSLNIGGETLSAPAKIQVPVTTYPGRSKSMPDPNGYAPQAAGQNQLVVEDGSQFANGNVLRLKWGGTIGDYFGNVINVYDAPYGFYPLAGTPNRQFVVNRGLGSQYVVTADDVYPQGLQVQISNIGTVPTSTPTVGQTIEDKFWLDDFTANGGYTITAISGNTLTLNRNLAYDVLQNTVVELASGVTPVAVVADFTPTDTVIERQTEQYAIIRQRGKFKNGATTFFPFMEGTLRTHFYKNQPFVRFQFQGNNHSNNNSVTATDAVFDEMKFVAPTVVTATGSDSVTTNAVAKTRDLANTPHSTIQAGSLKFTAAEFSERFPQSLAGSAGGFSYGLFGNTGTPHLIKGRSGKAFTREWYIGTNADIAAALTKFSPNAVQTNTEIVASGAFRNVTSIKNSNVTAPQVGGDATLAAAVNKAELTIAVAYDPSVGEPIAGSSYGTNPNKDIRGYRNDTFQPGYGWEQFGILNWAASPDPRCFNHYDLQAHLLMDFARSGNAEAFRRGSEAARAMSDVGTVRSRLLFNNNQYVQMQGVAYYENQNTQSELGFLKHSWQEGLWMYWALTGDESVHETALLSVVGKDENGTAVAGSLLIPDFGAVGPAQNPGAWYGNTTVGTFDILEGTNDGMRYVGWSIFNLLCAYRFTGVTAYLTKAQQYAECLRLSEIAQGSRGTYISVANSTPSSTPGSPTVGDDIASSFFFTGYCTFGLIELYRLTGSIPIRDFLVRIALHVIKGDANLPDNVNGFYPNALISGGAAWAEDPTKYEATHGQYAFYHDANSTLTGALSIGETATLLTNSSKMIVPGGFFSAGHLILTDGTNREIIRYTTCNGTTQVGGLTRGYLGTTPRAWPSGTTVGIFAIDGENVATFTDLMLPVLAFAAGITGRADLAEMAKRIFKEIGNLRGAGQLTYPKPLYNLAEANNRTFVNFLLNNGPGASVKVYGHTVYSIESYFAGALNNPLPVLSSLSATSAPQGGATQVVTITGSGFLAGSQAKLNGSNRTTGFISPTQVTIEILAGDKATSGIKLITVENSAPGGGTSNSLNFSVTAGGSAPTISNVNPASVPVNVATGNITITGTNLSSATVTVNGVAVTPTSNTATQIVLPTQTFGTVGSKTISVTTAGGTVNDSILATAGVPVIGSISPTTLPVNAAANITITGTDLGGATVNFNGGAATVVSNTATQLVVTIPSVGTPGAYLLDITTQGGIDSTNYTITALPVPAISSTSPNSAVTGVATGTITLTGSNLSNATVTVDGVAVSPATNTATQITLPSQTFTTVGAKSVVVNTAGGSANISINVTAPQLPAPTISSTNPTGLNAGASAQSVVLTGTGYQSGAIVRVGGQARTTTFLSATQVSVALTAPDLAVAGNLLLSVLNPDAQVSGNFTFVVAAVGTPTISSVSPSTVNPGSPAFTLAVLGTNFNSGSVVNLNGTAQTTVYVSASRLEVIVAAPLVAVAGNLLVTVTNAGVGTSAAATLPIQTVTSSLPKLRPGMRPQKTTLRIDQGKTFQITRQLKTSDGVSFDLTGVTMRLQMRRGFADSEVGILPLLDLTTENGGIVVDVPTGSFTINLTATDTTNLRFDRCYFEMEATTLQGVVVSLLRGDVRITKEFVR